MKEKIFPEIYIQCMFLLQGWTKVQDLCLAAGHTTTTRRIKPGRTSSASVGATKWPWWWAKAPTVCPPWWERWGPSLRNHRALMRLTLAPIKCTGRFGLQVVFFLPPKRSAKVNSQVLKWRVSLWLWLSVFQWTTTVLPSSSRQAWTGQSCPAPWSRPAWLAHSLPPC